jgi:6-pyruvoyltetrahydropterin/6-carboxytetrahydropterin synthase
MHGHSYHLTVVVDGPVDDIGFVCDFAEIKDIAGTLVKQLDHQCLNDIAGLENPTVEVQLVWMWRRLVKSLPARLVELRLRETANNTAVYRGVES